jgi:Ca-activated chloride channel family protein
MVEFSFTSQYAGLLLLLNGLVVLMFLYSRRKRRDRAMQFGNFETLEKVAGGKFLRSDDLILAVRVLAISALLLGLSSPTFTHEVTGEDENFVVALDASGSMFTSDIQPNRFQAAKDAGQSFIDQLGNSSSIGLISYAGNVSIEQELTTDHSEVSDSIQQVDIGAGGTAIGDAVSASVSMLTSSEKPGTVILVTDGRNTVGESLNQSQGLAQRQNVTVNTIGIGSSNGNREEFGIINGENASRMEFPNLNRVGLTNLSNSTGGESVFVSTGDQLESAFVQLEQTTAKEDISNWLFLLAGFLLVLEAVIRTTNFQVLP